MCGIAGIIQKDPAAYSQHHLKEMTGAISHRGPDGTRHWQNPSGSALFGHCRLAIIDLSEAAAQPMTFRSRYSIIHNGEIYNYIEIRAELEKKGYTFHTASDTEVILAAYDHYQDECVDHFDGMFAFAIWDEQEQELFAARDRFGEKPFYYSFSGRDLVFGSEMKALFAAGIEKRPNLQMLFNFITIGYTDNPGHPGETFFENIYKLPAASCLYFTPATGQLEIEKYWDIDTAEQQQVTAAEAIEQFTHLFKQSVKRRLRSDVAVGTSLSGGIDSSSIVSLVSEISVPGSSLNSFTASFPGFEKDESNFVSEVARQFSLNAHTVRITVADLVNDWDRLIAHQEEPFGSASAYAQYKVFELAGRHHVKVLLDGQGADETLAGYRKYYKWYWQELFQKRKLYRSGELRAAHEMGVHEKFTFKNVIAALFPDIASAVLEKQYLAHALGHPELDREFVHLQSKEAYYSTPATLNLNGALYFNTCIHGLEELLRMADRNSMAHGREVRLPFLDHRLVSFIFSLPASMKIHDGWSKWILRKAINGRLPDAITWRKNKVGFEPPQKEWMNSQPVKEMIHEARRTLVKAGVLKTEVVDRPIIGHAAYEPDAFDWRYLVSAPLFK